LTNTFLFDYWQIHTEQDGVIMLEELDPGRHYRAKIENRFAYLTRCTIQAVFSRSLWWAVAYIAGAYIIFECGNIYGQSNMKRRMVKTYNLVTDCETIEVPAATPNTTELYQLCG
jgi:hypothetical protein